MRIFWDITKTNKNKVYSGLNRVSTKLCESLILLGCEVKPIVWKSKTESFQLLDSASPVNIEAADYFVTPELFCENERPGAAAWLENCKGRTAAIFHDAIPLKFPEFTWPKSVARHPHYLKELANFDLILANSDYSKSELESYWSWLEIPKLPPVVSIPLGADFSGGERIKDSTPGTGQLQMLMIGILEPRKNQETVLKAVEILHAQGLDFKLSLVGRVNPHFGKPVVKKIDALRKKGVPVKYFQQISDAELLKLYQETDLTLFPSKTEGNGLPIIESIWNGKPPVVSPIPPHLEHAAGGEGVIVVDPMTSEKLAEVIKELILDPTLLQKATQATHSHKLPTWEHCGNTVIEALTRK